MATELWWGSGSAPAWRAMLGFAVKGVPYTGHLVSFSAGDQRKPEFLALNPRGQVPVVRDGSFVLNESLAILAWLDRKHPDRPLFGRDAEDHGRVWRAIFDHENHVTEASRGLVRAIFTGQVEAEAERIRAAVPAVHVELARFEASLADGYAVGDAVSAADLVWLPSVATLVRVATRPAAASLDLGWWPMGERYPRVLAWLGRLWAIPGVAETVPPHWLEGDAPLPLPWR